MFGQMQEWVLRTRRSYDFRYPWEWGDREFAGMFRVSGDETRDSEETLSLNILSLFSVGVLLTKRSLGRRDQSVNGPFLKGEGESGKKGRVMKLG